MAEQHLDDADVVAVVEKVSGKAVTHGVRGDAFAQARTAPGVAAGSLHGGGGEMLAGAPGGKQILLGDILSRNGWRTGTRMGGAPEMTEDLEQSRRQHGHTVFCALAVFDA